MKRHALYAFFSILILAPMGMADQPALVRVAVVDTSGSMQDKRISIVRTELRNVITQLPPSSDHPFVLVTFQSVAEPARIFTDEQAALAAVNKISVGGGTNIAAGLESALNEIRKYTDSAHVWVLFYSDGEDPNLSGILEQEAKLDAIFADRQQAGLAQTVILKRWGNANGVLKQRIEDRKHAIVTDLGEATLVPIRLDAKVDVVGVRWSTKKLGYLEVDVQPSVQINGPSGQQWNELLNFCCAFAGAEGETSIATLPGDPAPKVGTLLVPDPNDPTIGELKLPFKITPPVSQSVGSSLLVPLLANTAVEATVPLPATKLSRVYHVSHTIEPPSWLNPLELRARIPVRLNFDVQATGDPTVDTATTFQIAPEQGSSVLEGELRFTLPGPGSYSIPLVIEKLADGPSSDFENVRFSMRFKVSAVDIPARITIDPPDVEIVQENIDPPAQVITKITARQSTDASASWIDLKNAIAIADTTIEFNVDGPIPPQSEFTVVVPPSISRLEFVPPTLHSGRQSIKARIFGRFSAAPDRLSLSLTIVPPTAKGAVLFSAPQPLLVTILPPKPVRLLAVDGSRVVTRLATSIPDNVNQGVLRINPALANWPANQVDKSIRVSPQSKSPAFQLASHQVLQLNSIQTIQFKTPPESRRPFFSDTKVTGTVDLVSQVATPAISGSRYPVEITIRAPFKRLLFWTAITLSPIVALFLIGWLWMKFRQAAE